MNKGFYNDLDTNFKLACEMTEKNFSHAELLELLKNGNIPEKQIAALKIRNVYSAEEVETVLQNLTGCDGKIREAVALKILQLVQNNPQAKNLILSDKASVFAEIFANATIDINANVCRLVVDIISILKGNDVFDKTYLSKIITFINNSFSELDKVIFRDKKYAINKILFKLYWCLEALNMYSDKIDKVSLIAILNRASIEKEYTIREKVAQIVIKFNDMDEIKNKLKNDENYYVREVFKLNH